MQTRWRKRYGREARSRVPGLRQRAPLRSNATCRSSPTWVASSIRRPLVLGAVLRLLAARRGGQMRLRLSEKHDQASLAP